MSRTIDRIRRGLQDHPGTPVLILLLLVALLTGGWIALGLSAAIYIPTYLIGAYESAVFQERIEREEMRPKR